MNSQKWILFGVVTVLIALSAAFLNRLQAGRKLGQPGLKMVDRLVHDENSNVIGTNTVDLPLRVLDYDSEPLPVSMAELGWLPSDTTYGRRHYQNPFGHWVDISVVLMGTDRTSIHKPEVCLEGQGWGIERSDLIFVPVPRPQPYDLPVMRLLSPPKRVRTESGEIDTYRAVFAYWFVSDHRLTTKHGERMWWMARDLITSGVLSRWAYVAYYSICKADEVDTTFERMKEFIAASVPEFQLVPGPDSGGMPVAQMEGKP